MKTPQILAAGALLAGCTQACTRVRIDQSRDQSNPNNKYTSYTAWDDDKPALTINDFTSRINQENNHETLPYLRSKTGDIDVYMHYYQGPLAKQIGGWVAFPKAPGYPKLPLEQKNYFEYYNKDGIKHQIYCLWDNYNCEGKYTCGI
ncbi:hypothetical protein CBER1_11385 [Cercospora berteroae]|uniref:Uncharacterized protein n=1 Tax=Cercospora berteroae TaxID=357750 RepID=A0A2S6BZ40_9PEZI|nr:hypothetical protein CBER1_11385 [Cercospora berteroae]